MTTRLSRALLAPIVALTAICGADAGIGIGNPAEFLYDYDLMTVDLQATADSVRESGRLRLVLGGDTVDLQLEPYSVRSVDYRLYEVFEDGSVSVERTAPPDTYRFLFKDGGEARFLVSDTALFGYVHRNGEWFFVEPLSRFDGGAAPGELISYRQSDIVPDARESIGLAPRMDRLDTHAAAVPDGVVIEGTQPRLLELAAEADGEFTQSNGGTTKSAANVIEGIINEVDGIYDANLSVQVRLTATFVSVNPATDPWNSTQFGHGPMRFGPFDNSQGNIACSVNNGAGLWEQFRNYWNSNPARTGVRRDAAALFTTRDLRLCATAQHPEAELFGTAGELGSVCQFPNRAYTIQEQYAQVNSAGLAAHELGHSIGAGHDSSGCGGSPTDWIMCGTVQAQSTLFSPQSRVMINSHFNNHGACVVPPMIDLPVASGGTYHFSAPTPPNVGRTETITIRNLSTGTPMRIFNRTNLVSGACFQQVSTPPVTIPPNGSTNVNVRLLCASQGFKTGTLTVDTDDPVTPSYQVTLRGQVKSGTVFNIGFRAGYKPSFSAPRTTFTTFEAHPDGQLGFYFDPNQGRFENRPGGLCPPPASGENPGYFKVRLVGAAIDGCRFQASWDNNETVCNQSVINAFNSGTEIILSTDDVHNAPGSCQLAQPLDHHVNFGEDHHVRVTFLRAGGEYRRQINFRQNSQVHFSTVGHDTWVNQASPDTNYGQDTILRVSNQSGAVKYSFLYAGVPVNANIRSSHLLLAVGPATIGSAAVFEMHDPFLFGFCNENTLTWNSWPGCFNGFTHVQTINNIPGSSLLRFDVSGAVSPSGGLHAFGINTSDTAANRWFGSGESAADKPYLVTTTSN